MASAINLDYLPAVKMLLHAAKHPAYAVNGLLVCRQQDALEMNIVDYVPLFHSPLTLTPMLETALYQLKNDRLHPAEAGHFAVYSLSQGKWQETK
ncbi:hypothetical protein X801_06145 [Opisthorchis viverrini]|uniref:MPN domain-containing protein n=1 Tax=Opisthorchis viverrini TaxID=6198 RepID=A0A1S8WU10_OPIVI|nr:hypothetical protein X801_06145 [Opisthorchis viverrini]